MAESWGHIYLDNIKMLLALWLVNKCTQSFAYLWLLVCVVISRCWHFQSFYYTNKIRNCGMTIQKYIDISPSWCIHKSISKYKCFNHNLSIDRDKIRWQLQDKLLPSDYSSLRKYLDISLYTYLTVDELYRLVSIWEHSYHSHYSAI